MEADDLYRIAVANGDYFSIPRGESLEFYRMHLLQPPIRSDAELKALRDGLEGRAQKTFQSQRGGSFHQRKLSDIEEISPMGSLVERTVQAIFSRDHQPQRK